MTGCGVLLGGQGGAGMIPVPRFDSLSGTPCSLLPLAPLTPLTVQQAPDSAVIALRPSRPGGPNSRIGAGDGGGRAADAAAL